MYSVAPGVQKSKPSGSHKWATDNPHKLRNLPWIANLRIDLPGLIVFSLEIEVNEAHGDWGKIGDRGPRRGKSVQLKTQNQCGLSGGATTASEQEREPSQEG